MHGGGRDVAVANVPVAYLHASFPKDKHVILKLQSIFVDIMCEINPKFKNNIVYETTKCNKVVKCLYIRVPYSELCTAALNQHCYGMSNTPAL